jgi:Cu-Zn family superoxide dismutase
MTPLACALAPLSLLALGACSTVADLPANRIASATLTRNDGVPRGTVQIVATGNQVTLMAAATGLEPGPHGIHLHTTGSCALPDFTSAGGHLNPESRAHGSANPAGKHAGDLPNLIIQPGGSGSLTADLAGTPEQVRGWLFDADGSAVVIHAGPDDYRTDPAGNSGARIACGALKPA